MPVDDTLRALAHPARRAMLELVWDAERSSSELADAVALTRPAASQHLKVLRDAGLVQVRVDGNQRLWSGIFRKAEDEIILVTGVDWDAFIPQWKRMSAGSRRLVDFEMYNEGSKAMFAALYRGGSDTYSLWVGQDSSDSA